MLAKTRILIAILVSLVVTLQGIPNLNCILSCISGTCHEQSLAEKQTRPPLEVKNFESCCISQETATKALVPVKSGCSCPEIKPAPATTARLPEYGQTANADESCLGDFHELLESPNGYVNTINQWPLWISSKVEPNLSGVTGPRAPPFS